MGLTVIMGMVIAAICVTTRLRFLQMVHSKDGQEMFSGLKSD